MNPRKDSEDLLSVEGATSVKFLGISDVECVKIFPPRWKIGCALYNLLPSREAQCLVGLFGGTISHEESHLCDASYEQGLEQEKALQQVQAAIHAAPPLGTYDPAEPVIPKVPMTNGCHTEPLASTDSRIKAQTYRIFDKCSPFFYSQPFYFLETAVACYWNLVGTEHLNKWHWVTMQPELLIIHGMLSEQPNHKVGHAQQQSTITYKEIRLGKV